MFDYSVKFEAIDKISAKVEAINAKMATMQNKASQASSSIKNKLGNIKLSSEFKLNIQKALDNIKQLKSKMNEVGNKGRELAGKGIGALTGGVAFLAPLRQTLMAYQDVAQAQGEIRSLGIDDAGIKAITKSAMDFSNAWAGTTTADFIRASYDIKSGIASLSDVDVGKFTALAGMTANATKSTTAEMTKLFALGHGIFRQQFGSDVEFGEKFSSAISTAVQAFRTDGSDLVSGLSTLGATATAMGVSLEEQLAVLGTSKSAFNSASEGATSYRAFLAGAIKAQKTLGISFVDANNQMLPMAEILDRIKAKVKESGMTLKDTRVQQLLSQAFGSVEATKMINALIGKTDEMRQSQKMLFDNMQNGTKITREMAMAMQQGKEFELLQQKIGNLSAVIGGTFAPYMIKLSGAVGEYTAKIKAWIEENPILTQQIVKWVGIIGGALAVLGVMAVLIGSIGMAIGVFSSILTAVTFVFKAVTAVTWLFNSALWANPITWIVAGIIALIGAVVALIYYWEDITNWVGKLWEKFTGFIGSLNLVENALNSVKGYFNMLTAPIQYVIGLIDSFMSKFEIYNQAKAKVQDIAGAIENQASNAWENTKSFFGFGNDTQTQDATQIDNTNKNHTVVNVNIQATGGVVTEQNAQSNGGRVKLNTASNGV